MAADKKDHPGTDQEKPFPERKWYAAVLLTLGCMVLLFYFFTNFFK